MGDSKMRDEAFPSLPRYSKAQTLSIISAFLSEHGFTSTKSVLEMETQYLNVGIASSSRLSKLGRASGPRGGTSGAERAAADKTKGSGKAGGEPGDTSVLDLIGEAEEEGDDGHALGEDGPSRRTTEDDAGGHDRRRRVRSRSRSAARQDSAARGRRGQRAASQRGGSEKPAAAEGGGAKGMGDRPDAGTQADAHAGQPAAGEEGARDGRAGQAEDRMQEDKHGEEEGEAAEADDKGRRERLGSHDEEAAGGGSGEGAGAEESPPSGRGKEDERDRRDDDADEGRDKERGRDRDRDGRYRRDSSSSPNSSSGYRSRSSNRRRSSDENGADRRRSSPEGAAAAAKDGPPAAETAEAALPPAAIKAKGHGAPKFFLDSMPDHAGGDRRGGAGDRWARSDSDRHARDSGRASKHDDARDRDYPSSTRGGEARLYHERDRLRYEGSTRPHASSPVGSALDRRDARPPLAVAPPPPLPLYARDRVEPDYARSADRGREAPRDYPRVSIAAAIATASGYERARYYERAPVDKGGSRAAYDAYSRDRRPEPAREGRSMHSSLPAPLPARYPAERPPLDSRSSGQKRYRDDDHR